MDNLPFDVIGMNWWMLESPLETRAGRQQLIELMAQLLPNCLPENYGVSEPPTHNYDHCGKEHFLQFLDENLGFSVWYPRRPIVGVSLQLPSPPGPKIIGVRFLGFRMNHLSIRFEKAILEDASWTTKLFQFWQAVSKAIRPVYGDVRNLGPHRWQGPTIGCLAGSKAVGWWWSGIPRDLGKAVVLGVDYQRLWPHFSMVSRTEDGFAFASLCDWQSEDDLAEVVGAPPEDQAVVIQDRGNFGTPKPSPKFPEGWPFGNPYPN
jgi:hypothetical protein